MNQAPAQPVAQRALRYRRDTLIIAVLALLVGLYLLSRTEQPGYTDAYYYFNAGQRLATGQGLTDAALWTYVGAPANLPVPSHLYWMPAASLVAALGMIFGPTFHAAQIPFIVLYAGLVVVGFQLGAALGGTRRSAWMAGLLTMFSGFYMPYWATTDTFAFYGLTGSLSLIGMGLGRQSGKRRWYALSGAMEGLAHLARADGILLIMILVLVALWPERSPSHWRKGIVNALIGIIAYGLIMTPWFIRNTSQIGTLLPVGGFQTAYMRNYDELFNYPPGVNLRDFLASGVSAIWATRWEAFINNFQTLIAVEGLIVVLPLALIGFWKRRRDPLLSGFWLYALGLHLVMTLVFAIISWRGGLLHSSAALLPFWMALGAVGLDDLVTWAAKRRRWPVAQAKAIFGGALIVWAVGFSFLVVSKQSSKFSLDVSQRYQELQAKLAPGTVVMINDPSELYYFTHLSGVVLPNAPPTVIPDLVERYGVNVVIIEKDHTAPMDDLWTGKSIPDFLTLTFSDPTMRIYLVKHDR